MRLQESTWSKGTPYAFWSKCMVVFSHAVHKPLLWQEHLGREEGGSKRPAEPRLYKDRVGSCWIWIRPRAGLLVSWDCRTGVRSEGGLDWLCNDFLISMPDAVWCLNLVRSLRILATCSISPWRMLWPWPSIIDTMRCHAMPCAKGIQHTCTRALVQKARCFPSLFAAMYCCWGGCPTCGRKASLASNRWQEALATGTWDYRKWIRITPEEWKDSRDHLSSSGNSGSGSIKRDTTICEWLVGWQPAKTTTK